MFFSQYCLITPWRHTSGMLPSAEQGQCLVLFNTRTNRIRFLRKRSHFLRQWSGSLKPGCQNVISQNRRGLTTVSRRNCSADGNPLALLTLIVAKYYREHYLNAMSRRKTLNISQVTSLWENMYTISRTTFTMVVNTFRLHHKFIRDHLVAFKNDLKGNEWNKAYLRTSCLVVIQTIYYRFKIKPRFYKGSLWIGKLCTPNLMLFKITRKVTAAANTEI